MNSQEIINYIANSPKLTPVKVFLKGDLSKIDFNGFKYFGGKDFGILFCQIGDFELLLSQNQAFICDYTLEIDRRNSAIPLADLSKYNARIEPGAVNQIIR